MYNVRMIFNNTKVSGNKVQQAFRLSVTWVEENVTLVSLSLFLSHLTQKCVVACVYMRACDKALCVVTVFVMAFRVMCFPLAVTYKRIAPRQRIMHDALKTTDLNKSRPNVSRKRKKPGSGMFTFYH